MSRSESSNPDVRRCAELLETAKSRFEATEAAALQLDMDLERIRTCGDSLLGQIHAGPQQARVMWVLETAVAMQTAVMAVGGYRLPVAGGVDPASFAMSVLRDLKTSAAEKGLDFIELEACAAECLRNSASRDYSDVEIYWALNRATAQLELAWARAEASEQE